MNGKTNPKENTMKKNIFPILLTLAMILGITSCQHPEELLPSTSRNGINGITASFPNDDRDENAFTSEVDYANHVITVVVPYNYPKNSNNVITKEHLKDMIVKANLDDNVYVTPKLLRMDLSKENNITIIDQVKNKIDYKVIAEIRKSDKCEITEFSLSTLNLTGVIDNTNKTISIISLETLGNVLADVSISHGATISPDPRTTELNYDVEQELTVTAQNGTTQAVYTVRKTIPEKVAAGIRGGSGKLLWARKLTDVGITTPHITGGIAALQDYLVLNTRGINSYYLDAKTGENAGTLDISSIAGGLTNFYNTADDDDNILICNLAPNAGPDFKIWRVNGISSTPQEFISWNTGGLPIGRKMSIKGSINKNAIITATIHAAPARFARWQVVNGSLVSQTPDIVAVNGVAWTTNADVVYTQADDVSSDYFASFYGSPYMFTRFDGNTNSIKAQGTAISANWIPNAVDYVEFNNVPYALHNSVNSFTWGSDDSIYLYDLSTGGLSTLIKVCDSGIYGGKNLGVANANGTGDVAFKVSENGYYLYVYFMFTNGYVVCTQFDCIDM